MTQRAFRSPASLAAAWPGGSRPMRSRSSRRAASCLSPPAARIAPSTPPPPNSPLLAALTTASTSSSTMSPRTTTISTRDPPELHFARHPAHETGQQVMNRAQFVPFPEQSGNRGSAAARLQQRDEELLVGDGSVLSGHGRQSRQLSPFDHAAVAAGESDDVTDAP